MGGDNRHGAGRQGRRSRARQSRQRGRQFARTDEPGSPDRHRMDARRAGSFAAEIPGRFTADRERRRAAVCPFGSEQPRELDLCDEHFGGRAQHHRLFRANRFLRPYPPARGLQHVGDGEDDGIHADDYRLEELAHSGCMATLWRVSRPGVTMPLLMKVPRIGEGADPAAIVSFEMEQMILPRLTGVHVPKFVAAGDFAAQPYIVMEAIPGQTLLPRLPELPLPDAEVAKIGAKIAMALDDLHRQHVVHLDIKPSNIMFRPTGEAVLLDYGLSHHFRLPDLMQEEFRLPFGTAPYMSPEQLRGIRNDPRSDLFALGVLLYFFTTGVRPFGESETL